MFMIYGSGTVIYKTDCFCESGIDRLCIYENWKRNFWSCGVSLKNSFAAYRLMSSFSKLNLD